MHPPLAWGWETESDWRSLSLALPAAASIDRGPATGASALEGLLRPRDGGPKKGVTQPMNRITMAAVAALCAVTTLPARRGQDPRK